MTTNDTPTAVPARIHRVGSLTLGLTLLLFGVLFLLHTVGLAISYEMILRLWPVVLIILGIEILLAVRTERISYAKDQPDSRSENPAKVWFFDKTAIWLIILMSFFSMGMAVADMSIHYICQSIGSTPLT